MYAAKCSSLHSVSLAFIYIKARTLVSDRSLKNLIKAEWILFTLVTLMAVAFFLLAKRMPLTADTAGYEFAARQLTAGNGLAFDDPHNALVGKFFSPFAFQIKHPDDSRLYLGFPPGFPLLLALSGIVTGSIETIHYVVPVLAIIGLLLTFVLGTWLVKNQWVALLSVAILALMPIYWRFGTEAWSEVPAMVFVLAGTIFYFSARSEDGSERAKMGYAILAGIALVFSLFIRYANITFLLSIGLAELLLSPRELLKPSKKWLFYGVLVAGLFGILAFNHFYYGGIRLTSYSPENGWYNFPPFSLQYAFGASPVNGFSLREAGKSLWENFSLLLLFMPVGWWALPRSFRPIVLFSIVGSIGLYAIYAFAPAGINSRFLIPVFPFLAILAAQGIRALLVKLGDYRLQGAVVLIVFMGLAWHLYPEIVSLRDQKTGLETAVSHIKSTMALTEANAVMMTYGWVDHIAYYGNRSVLNYRRIPQYDPVQDKYRFDLFEPCLVYAIDTLLLSGTPVYFHEDQSPTLYNAKDILEKHYLLTPAIEEPKFYRVSQDALTTVRESASVCTP